jgi:hypothetical protein
MSCFGSVPVRLFSCADYDNTACTDDPSYVSVFEIILHAI